MNSIWCSKWKKALIWFSSYISFVAFALVGGYVILKEEDEGLKKTVKQAFFVTLIISAVSAFLSFISNFVYIVAPDASLYNFNNVMNAFNRIVSIADIVTHAVFILLTFFGNNDKAQSENTEDNNAT